jgi:glucose/arabinose dehydrogenase
MILYNRYTAAFATCVFLFSCGPSNGQKAANQTTSTTSASDDTTALPPPYATKSSIKFSNVIGWKDGKMPIAPPGYTVTKFADELDNPRWIYVAPNGDIFVAESNTEPKGVGKKVASLVTGKSKSQKLGNSANRITLFRDQDGDGIPETRTTFLEDLNQPFGMLILGNSFYVANTDALLQFPYQEGQTSMTTAGKKIMDLPADGYNNHWTRNIIASHDGKKILVAVGSASNVGEHGMDKETRRACVLEINPDGSGERIFASGIRNGQGMAYAPGTQTLWISVNERDELGDELVPDYMTSVKDGGFYGWPYAYWGQHPDPRLKGERPDLVRKSITPDVSLGSHTASLGLAFDTHNLFTGHYQGGAFIGQHGSWNRSEFSGYRVAFVPFSKGKPTGAPEDFLTGFVVGDGNKVYGRPVGVAFTKKALLVADDAANTIWRVTPTGK